MLLPNNQGVYAKDDAEAFIFESKYIYVIAHLLCIEDDTWLHAVSYSLKVLPDGGCTAGRSTPLKAWERTKSVSREAALARIRSEIASIVQTGRTEIKINAWKSTWFKLDAWGFNIERQLALFA